MSPSCPRPDFALSRSLLLILPLFLCPCCLLLHLWSRSLPRFCSRCLFFFPSLTLLSSLVGSAPCATLSSDSQANCPGSRSLQPGLGGELSCSGTTAANRAWTRASALGPERGRSEPAEAAGAATAPQRRARPSRPVRNGGSGGQGVCGQRCLRAVPDAAGGFRNSTGGLRTLVPQLVTSRLAAQCRGVH